MESKSVDTRSIYRELGATLSYNMRLGNGMEIEPWLKAAVRKEFVDDNRVKVNSDGNLSMICRADVEYTRQVLKPHSAVC